MEHVWTSSQYSPENGKACTMRALCDMNRLAADLSAWNRNVVALSSVPLCMLLHHRENGGFSNFLSASLTGFDRVDCSAAFRC